MFEGCVCFEPFSFTPVLTWGGKGELVERPVPQLIYMGWCNLRRNAHAGCGISGMCGWKAWGFGVILLLLWKFRVGRASRWCECRGWRDRRR